MAETERESIQTRADTAHLGLAGQLSRSSLSAFNATERMGLATGLSVVCTSFRRALFVVPPVFE